MLHKILTKILLEVKDKYGYTIRRFGLFKNTYAFFWNIVASKVVVSKINGVGARMLLDLNDIYMAARIYVNDYELVETKLFKSLLKPGMNVVDVGAAIGYYTCIAGKLLGPEGKVYAFEPAPRNFSILRKNTDGPDIFGRIGLKTPGHLYILLEMGSWKLEVGNWKLETGGVL